VRDALAAGIPLEVYGVGWEEFLAPDQIAGEFLPNSELPNAYANSSLVLNDHHREMAQLGFLSNRLFDSVAAGARVVSDPASGISDVFGSSVVTYRTPEELAQIYRNPDAHFPVDSTDAQRIRTEHDFRARARTLIAAAESARHE
jgi:spore maturation protein CgeB